MWSRKQLLLSRSWTRSWHVCENASLASCLLLHMLNRRLVMLKAIIYRLHFLIINTSSKILRGEKTNMAFCSKTNFLGQLWHSQGFGILYTRRPKSEEGRREDSGHPTEKPRVNSPTRVSLSMSLGC